MSKKTTPKKKPAAKKAKAKPVKGKSSAKKAAKPVKKKSTSKPKSKAKPKIIAKKAVKGKAKVVAKKAVKAKSSVKSKPAKVSTKAKAPVVIKSKQVVNKKQRNEKPSSPISKEADKNSETPKNNIGQNRPSVARPFPVNRRPEPARAIIRDSKPEKETGKNRYSDTELEEFRDIINKKLDEARRELATLQAQMTAANDHGTDDTASTFKILEDGSDSLAKEEAGQLASRQKKFIEQLENALVRIENKTYGICRVTGKLIPKERLRAVPHTTQSIEAKLNQYRD
jgi:RNA polymerase-binding transcription factor DksA